MATNPFARQMAAEECVISRDLGRELTDALRHRSVQSQADALTEATTRRPPREVVRIFERALASALRRAQRSHRAMQIDACASYALVRESWQATVCASARFRLRVMGGASHVLAAGDTLWSVSERYYGHGAYWSAIADENPRATDSRHRFLMCGAGLTIPRIEVCEQIASIRALSRETRAPREAMRPARLPEIPYPEVQCTMQASRPVRLAPVCIGGVSVEVTVEPQGSIVVNRPGTVPARFDCRRYRVQVAAEIDRITAAFRISSFTTGRLTISNRLLGGRYSVSLNLDSDGSFGFSIAERRSTVTIRGMRVTSSIGFEVTIRVSGLCGSRVGVESPQGARSAERSRRGSGRGVEAADVAAAGGAAAALGFAAALGRVLAEIAGRVLQFATMPIIVIEPPGGFDGMGGRNEA